MRLSFETWGEGRGGRAPVLLLHSILEDRKTWRNIGPDIARGTGRKVFAVDFCNHGLSPSSEEYGVWALKADVVDFLEQQDIHRVALVGHSMGGMVAAIIAITKPALVEKLVIEEMPPFGVDHSPSPSLLLQVEEVVRTILDSPPRNLDHGSALRHVISNLTPLLDMLRLSRSFAATYDPLSLPFRWDGKALSPAINLPAIARAAEKKGTFHVVISGRYEGEVLILTGARSNYTRNPDSSSVSQNFPKRRCVTFEGVGHFVHHMFPWEFTREVVSFLNAPAPSKL